MFLTSQLGRLFTFLCVVKILHSITIKGFFTQILVVALLQKNLLMLLAVRLSNYGCTWEVWRALTRALQTSRVHPFLDIRTLSMNKFLTLWLECDLTSGRLANIGISTKRRDTIKEASILRYLRPFVVTTWLRISPFRNIQCFSTQPSPNPAFLL